MGPSNTHNSLGAFLANTYTDLELKSESVGYSLWSGRVGTDRFAVHCLAEWSLEREQRERILDTYHDLSRANLCALPALHGCGCFESHLLLVEEWVAGTLWSGAVVSRLTALQCTVELCDVLAELHEMDLAHGGVNPSNLLIEDDRGRLRLLNTLSWSRLEEPDRDSDLRNALNLLRYYLSDEEQTELAGLTSARDISRHLSKYLTQVTPGRLQSQFIGRDRPLARLTQLQARGGLVRLEAPAGGGKTRLLEEWSRTQSAEVLWGKVEREAVPTPFLAFREPLLRLEALLAENKELTFRLRRELNLRFPILDSMGGTDYLQRSSAVWLARLFSLVHLHIPLVLVLEDVHWADDFTQKFLEFWNSERREMLVVASYRGEEVGPDILRIKSPLIRLSPLTSVQATRVLRSVHPSASQTLLESALRRAEGNPFLLLQFVRSGSTRGDFQQARLSGLPKKLQKALAAAAVLGNRFQPALLETCRDERVDFEPAVSEGLLQSDGEEYRFTHDRIREACLTLIDRREAAALQLTVARELTRSEDADPFVISYRFFVGGEPEQGLPYSLKAAEQARAKDDLTTAAFYFRAALAGLGPSSEQRPKILYELGDCLRLTGRYEESEKCFEEAEYGTVDSLARARIKHALGDVYFKQDQLEKAREAIVSGLKLLGERTPVWVTGAFAAEALRLVFRTCTRRVGSRRNRERDLMKARLYNRLAYIDWFLKGTVASVWAHFCELNLAELYGESPELAKAQANHAMAMSALPWWSRSLEYGRRAVLTAQNLKDKWTEGQVGHFCGAALLGAGRLQEARKVLLRSQKLLEETGDRWEENGVRYHLARVYYRLGALDKATEISAETQRIGVEIQDRLAAGDNLNIWALARHGSFPLERVEQEKAYSSPDLMRTCELLSAEGLWYLRRGHYHKSVKLFKKAIELYRKNGVQNLYSAPIPCWLTTAQRLLSQKFQGELREKHLAEAAATCKIALAQARKYPTNLPHALREDGLLSLLRGRLEHARRAFNDSALFAAENDLGFESKVTRAVVNHFHWLLGADRSQDVEPGVEYLWLLGESAGEFGTREHLEQLLDSANRISTSLSVETALHNLCLGSEQTLRVARSCTIVEVDREGKTYPLAGGCQVDPPPFPFEDEDWTARLIPGLDYSTYLLIHHPGNTFSEQSSLLTDFLISVTCAVLDRARRTASAYVLSRDLEESSSRLDLEASRLSRAREQLLLSERLAVTGRLATGLLHDLRNLTLTMTSSAEVLLIDCQPGQEKHAEIVDILESGRKANQILTRLNGLARGDVMGSQPVDLAQRISGLGGLFRSLCGPTVELQFELEKTPTVQIDPMACDRILLNLVVNARDAVGPGGRVSVATSGVEVGPDGLVLYPNIVPPGSYAKVSVADNGAGISPENLPRIFELHFTTKGTSGTGVGLASVMELVKTNEGYLTVNSGPTGTIFEIYFRTTTRI